MLQIKRPDTNGLGRGAMAAVGHSRRIWQVRGMSANGPISDTPVRHYGDVNLAQRAQIVRHVDDFSAVGESSVGFYRHIGAGRHERSSDQR
jgi:hypothetical protein